MKGSRFLIVIVLTLATFLSFKNTHAQTFADTTRLVKKLNAATTDSLRVAILERLVSVNRFNGDMGIAYANRTLAMDKNACPESYGYVFMHLSTIYKTKGKHKLAEEYALKTIEFAKSIGLVSLEAKGYGTLGNVYRQTGDVKNSSIYLEKALSLFIETKDSNNIMLASMNLGGFYYSELMYDKALKYFETTLDYAKKSHNEYGLANGYNNLGGIMLNTGRLDSAFNCYKYAIKLSREFELSEMANVILGNLGDVRKKQGRYDEALEYYGEQYADAKKQESYQGISQSLSGLIEVYRDQKKYDLAIQKIAEYRTHVSSEGAVDDLLDVYGLSSDVYARKGMYKEAYEARKRFGEINDSINSSEVKNTIFELHEQYQSERKDNEILKKTADLEKEQGLSKQRSTQRNILLIIVAFALVMIGLVFRSYLQKKKYNEEITIQKNEAEKQKELVTEKNKEILDSINYAKHIQEAILPSHDINTDVVKESFVLYKPKDIVAGDFYWYGVKNNKRIITAADCTGHGVPGALMSMLGITFLNEIVNHMGKTKPSDILSELRDLVKATLKQTGSEGESKDGMDMALISLDPATLKLEFCGANNPLWIFRTENGKTEFTEIAPDKRPVGYFRGMGIPFTNKEFQLKNGDRIYLFTDGYADQFGGPKGKKFKYKQLHELFASVLEKPMNEQHKIISDTFDAWKGLLEQVDDVCVVGLRV